METQVHSCSVPTVVGRCRVQQRYEAPAWGSRARGGLMEAQPAPAALGPRARLSSQLDWYWTLPAAGRAAFWATFGGWALDAYNQMTAGFILPAVTTQFALSGAQAGLIGTVGMVTSAVGGALAGALADTIGRVRVLVAEYSQASQRGKVVGAVQAAWAVGYAAVLIANTVAFSVA